MLMTSGPGIQQINIFVGVLRVTTIGAARSVTLVYNYEEEADVERGACGQEKFENNELCRSSGADEELVRSWATTSVSANTKIAGTLKRQ